MNSSSEARRSFFKWTLRLLGGALVVALLLMQRGTAARLLETFGRTPLWVGAASVAFYLLGQALCAWKWQLLLRARGIEVSFSRCFSIYLAGMFANLWLPTNIGGDTLRVSLLSRTSGASASDAFASVLLDRLSGFAALLLLAMLGLLGSGATSGQWPLVAVSLAVFCVVIGALLLLPRASHPKIKRIGEAVAAYQNPRVLLVCLALSLVFQASQIALNFALARALGLRVGLWEMSWIGPILSLSGLVPLGIGGLCTREVAAVALLGRLGIASGEAVAWSLMWQASVWGASLPGMFCLQGGRNARVD